MKSHSIFNHVSSHFVTMVNLRKRLRIKASLYEQFYESNICHEDKHRFWYTLLSLLLLRWAHRQPLQLNQKLKPQHIIFQGQTSNRQSTFTPELYRRDLHLKVKYFVIFLQHNTAHILEIFDDIIQLLMLLAY